MRRGVGSSVGRPFVPFTSVQSSTAGLRPISAPLFEEKGDTGIEAPISNIAHPIGIDRPRARAAFAADDDPVDAVEVEVLDWADQRFEREEPDHRVGFSQVADARYLAVVLDRGTEPDVVGCLAALIAGVDVAAHQRAAFGEDLEDVLVGLFHGVEHAVDEVNRHVLVKHVAHGVDEDHPRAAPFEGLVQPLGAEHEVEAVLVGVALHTPEALGETLRVAVITTDPDLGTAGDRIPRGVGPLDCRVVRHNTPPHSA